MQTKLSVFCERLMEAGWLMAVILAPLYFNVYTNRVFEPDKISLVRSIAVLMIVAWIVKVIETNLVAVRGNTGSGLTAPVPFLRRLSQQNVLSLPTLALVVVYLISTVASIAPMITLWGSYQRLQGTYSTFSYIVIFFLAANTIRNREQLERVISTIILTSVPISIYGIVEHLKLEFLPWGGDVTLRVTSTMGNPIFIAAYLIMTVPLALGRALVRLQAFTRGDDKGEGGRQAGLAAMVPMLQAVAWFLVIYFGLRVYGDFILGQPSSTVALFILLTCLILAIALPLTVRRQLHLFMSASFYSTVTLVQLATIFFSQSRGPQLGLAAGLVVFIFLYAMKWNSRVIWFGGLAAAIGGLGFLIVINLPNSPLAFVRDMPYIGRLGALIDDGGGSTRVRSLIWEGARDLIGYHEPIEVPDQSPDPLNLLRPLIGYGPEAMYVAYNRFYPPELAHHEARNASPDRSHNETFDALVMTGILGYCAYWVVFYTAIYMALRYLAVIDERHGRYLYIALLLSGLVALVIIYTNLLPIKFTPGPPLLGVAVLSLYLLIAGIFTYTWRGTARPLDLMLIALVSAIVAHFVEIQFGIAIASTRTHFWLMAALVVVAGRLLPQAEAKSTTGDEKPAPQPVVERAIPVAEPRPPAATASFGKKKKSKVVAAGKPRRDVRSAPRPAAPRRHDQDIVSLIALVVPRALPLAVVGGIILTTLAYNFMLPPGSQTQQPRTTSMQFWLYFLTWLSCALIVAFDGKLDPRRDEINQRIAALIVYTVVSLGMWVIYVALRSLVLAASGAQVDPVALVRLFYVVMALYGPLLALALYNESRAGAVPAWGGVTGGIVYALITLAALFFVVLTNVNIILADVHYKTGLAYDNARRWDGSIQAYQQAISLTPGQDFYYLFLGRSFMELARQFPDREGTPPFDPTTESPLTMKRERLGVLGREDLIRASLVVLEKARDLNPLNTDHYANLARLHRFWGEVEDRSKLELADKYFRQAVSLSPNNAQLWNEWAIVSILLGDLDEAQRKLDHSLELDDRYDLTYFYRGNLFMNRGENTEDAAGRLDLLTKAADAYSSCLEVTPTYWECAKARGYLYGKYLGRSLDAVADFLMVAGSLPRPEDVNRIADAHERQRATLELINVNQNLAITYGQLGQFDKALAHAQIASQLSPNDQALKNLVEQLKAQQK